MANNGKLQLEVVDASDKPIKEKIDVVMRHQIRSITQKATINGAAAKPVIGGLDNDPPAVYRIEVDPPSYLPVEQFINLKPSGTTELKVTCPIDPGKIKGIEFPKFNKIPDDAQKLLSNSAQVFKFEGKKGDDLYSGLDDVRRAGFLNLITKAQATPLSSQTNVLSFIQELRELRGDRFFAFVSRELREETVNSISEGLFHKVSGSLHKLPPLFTGFKDDGSYKTGEGHGNLQLTFFRKGDEFVVDIDIDDAGGLEHVFQVIRNRIGRLKTNPFVIHDILLKFQKLDPGYRFIV